MTPEPATHDSPDDDRSAAAATIALVRRLIEKGEVRPGDRLAPERQLAQQAGVGRSGLREGLRALAAMGIVRAHRGSGTYISAAPTLGGEALGLLAALFGVTGDGLVEALCVVERGAAALAAKRATDDQIAEMAHEVAGMFASLDDPEAFLRHDRGFHRAVAAAAANQILAAFLGMVLSRLDADRRVDAAARDARRESAERHRRQYRAIRGRDIKQARTATHDDHRDPIGRGAGAETRRTSRRQRWRQQAS